MTPYGAVAVVSDHQSEQWITVRNTVPVLFHCLSREDAMKKNQVAHSKRRVMLETFPHDALRRVVGGTFTLGGPPPKQPPEPGVVAPGGTNGGL
jgi:hypothetical protein